jgi:NAD(P)H dehydrogenase (quinone)
MIQRKVLILLGHENKETYCGAIADAYERAATEAGHAVKRVNISDLSFDPILHKGYKVIQELEPDLKTFQEMVRWSEHLVVIYPNWWSTMPAILKGLFDRAWLPGFAFKFHKDNAYAWDKLLKGRTARVIITMNAAPMLERMMIGDFSNEIRNGILKYAGFSPVRLTTFGPVERCTDAQRQSWLKKIASIGRDAI